MVLHCGTTLLVVRGHWFSAFLLILAIVFEAAFRGITLVSAWLTGQPATGQRWYTSASRCHGFRPRQLVGAGLGQRSEFSRSAETSRLLLSSRPPTPSTWTELIGSQRGVEGISLSFHGRRPLGPHPGFPPGLSWMALGRGVNNATVVPIVARRVGGPGGQRHPGFAASLPRSLGFSQTKARPLVLKVMVSDLVKAPRRTLAEDGAAEPVSGRRTRHSVLTQFQKCFMI